MLMGVWESVREWIPTLPSEFPLGELESRWTPESLKSNYRGQNPLDRRVLYIIEKILKLKFLKWPRMTHLGSWISYGQKKGRESNWQFDFQPLKVKNHPNFLVFKQHVTYHWKTFDKGYNFVLDLTSIEGFHTKLWASKMVKVLILGISGLPFGTFGTKWYLGVGPVARHKEYCKGGGGGFPQVRAVVSIMSLCLFVARPSTKVL